MNDAIPASFVVSAPSGAGKTSLADRLLAGVSNITRTISHTTRTPRSHETDGVDYFFVDRPAFEATVAADGFLEWATVHCHLYGTPRAEIERIQLGGNDALMVIDVQGAAAVRRMLPDAVTIFVLPPSRKALIERLDGRDGLGGGEGRAERLRVAEHEIAEYVSYDYVIINDDFELAVQELVAIVNAERCRQRRRQADAEQLLADFRAASADA
ncbi:MAG: guanylate kinase [Acidobacteria bacterium]|nr:guanylate kinase [Acidobacteriota bacterium]